MVDDVKAFVANMAGRGVQCTEPKDQGWGVLTSLSLPGGGALGVYEPRHARPIASEPRKAVKAVKARKAGKARKPQAKRKVAAKKSKPVRRARRR